MSFRDHLHDRQAETAAAVPTVRVLAPREPFEDPRLVGGSDTATGVTHPETNLVVGQR
jgi:hypothetical protein